MKQKPLAWLAVILGVLFIILGLVYATHQAQNLPHFIPGYQAGLKTVHVKHSIAAFLLGVACFVYAWFKSGKKN